jgi:ubiquinone biosynthesis protein COQ9
MTAEELRGLLIPAILGEIPFEGLNPRCLRLAAARAGLSEVELDRALPQGVRSFIEHWHLATDAAMLMALAEHDLPALKTRDRVKLAIRLRLELLAPHREAVRRTFTVLALPGNQLLAARLLYRTLDDIWHACGDRSADFNFYTKRGLLGAIYSATVLVWLDDESEGFETTWDFLDRRIVDVMKIPQMVAKLRDWPRALVPPFFARNATRP